MSALAFELEKESELIIKVHENACMGKSGVDEVLLALFGGANDDVFSFILLCNEWRDVGFESATGLGLSMAQERFKGALLTCRV